MESNDEGRLLDAFNRYYNQYSQPVYNRLRWQMAGFSRAMKQDVEDLHQIIFLSAHGWMKRYWEETHQVPPENLFRRALYKIELKRNDYMREYIYRQENETALVSEPYADEAKPEPGAVDPPADDPSPEDQLLLSEQMTKFESCLDRLRHKERLAVLYKAIGYSDREIAALIDEDASTVTHSIIPQARKKLRQCMEGYRHGNGAK